MAAFNDEDRVAYQTLKEWALNSFFDYCRDRGIVMSMSHFEVLGYVGYDFEDGFERDIEDLMWQVVLLVLSGGWHPEWDNRQRELIAHKMDTHTLEELLVGVPEAEAEQFKHDLKILGLLPETL